MTQDARIDEILEARVALAERLSKGLAELPGIIPPAVEDGCSHTYYFHVSKYDPKVTGLPRDYFVRGVAAEGYAIRAGYVKPIYLEPMYQQKIAIGRYGFPFSANSNAAQLSYGKGLCPTVERLQDAELFLTHMIYPPLTYDDMDGFVSACRKVLSYKEEILAAASDGIL